MKTDRSTAEDRLLQQYCAGDQKAAAELTRRLLPAVYGHASRLLGDRAEAEDVAQEAMLRLWRIAPEWRTGEAQVRTWLYRVTANLAIDRLRRRKSFSLNETGELQDSEPSATDALQDKSRAAALQGALGDLPERQRQAIVLRHLEGLGNVEIARIMDITPRAVESLTARGKRTLAQLLFPRRDELGYENETE